MHDWTPCVPNARRYIHWGDMRVIAPPSPPPGTRVGGTITAAGSAVAAASECGWLAECGKLDAADARLRRLYAGLHTAWAAKWQVEADARRYMQHALERAEMGAVRSWIEACPGEGRDQAQVVHAVAQSTGRLLQRLGGRRPGTHDGRRDMRLSYPVPPAELPLSSPYSDRVSWSRGDLIDMRSDTLRRSEALRLAELDASRDGGAVLRGDFVTDPPRLLARERQATARAAMRAALERGVAA